MGLEGKFITTCIYRYTRNPQYVTHILLIAAVVLVANSALALQVGIPYALWFMLAPFSEEAWLIKQILTGYNNYPAVYFYHWPVYRPFNTLFLSHEFSTGILVNLDRCSVNDGFLSPHSDFGF